MTKTVQIQIGRQDLQALKANGDELCVARRVNGGYSVVWQASGNYLLSNQFSWAPEYALFGSNSFVPNTSVQIITNVVNIGLGQQAVLTSNGSIEAPSAGSPAGTITLIDQHGPIHPGLCGLATGLNGNQTLSPMFVASNAIAAGSMQMTPVDELLIWFQQNTATGTIIPQSPRNTFHADLTNTDSVTCIYQNGGWSPQYLSDVDAEAKTAPKPPHHQHGRH